MSTAVAPEIAALVREVLAEEVARLRAEKGARAAGAGMVREERVRIRSDADLRDFATRVLAMAEDAESRRALAAGRIVFRLDGAVPESGGRSALTASSPRTTGSGKHGGGRERSFFRAAGGTPPPGYDACPPRPKREDDAARARPPAPAGHRDRKDVAMIKGRVIGRVWSTKRLEALPQGALLEVEIESGARLIAFDPLGCGEGEEVLVTQGSVAARVVWGCQGAG